MSLKDSCSSALEAFPATIAGGSSVSGTVNLGGLRLFGLCAPSEWTAAGLTFQSSYDGGVTWRDVYKSGSEYLLSVTAGKDLDVDIQRFSSIPVLRLRSGTSASPVAQAEDRTITLVLRSI